jgi:aspartyl-tRNA(Asn)/glutamyl-tRNA(Gln) amidotransferase subunit C
MLDRTTIDHIAELAKLDLTAEERAMLGAQVSDILGYIEQLTQLDISSVQSGAVAGAAALRLRPDIVTPSLTREVVLSLAPEVESGHVRVPPLQE